MKENLIVAQTGVVKSYVSFRCPALADWRWPTVDIVGHRPGPWLAVVAGIHVNETSSIEAAIRLQRAFDPAKLSGRVSIMPVVNLPAIPHRSQYVCPLDGKNINFSFPGRPDGTFAEAIAHALLTEWAADADCLVDLHGGDLCENVAHFTVCQTTGRAEFDARNLDLARCFDSELIVVLDSSHLDQPGRSCTGRARYFKHAAFAEAGRIGMIEENNIAFHYEGVQRIAHYLGMITAAPPPRREAQLVDRYLWLAAPVDGFYRYRFEVGQRFAAGTLLAIAEDTFGETIAEMRAPEAGFILWTITHAFVTGGSDIMGLGIAG